MFDNVASARRERNAPPHSKRRNPSFLYNRSVADAHAAPPPAMAAVRVSIRVCIGMRIGAAVYSASAIRSPMKAGAAAARG